PEPPTAAVVPAGSVKGGQKVAHWPVHATGAPLFVNV
ncbi:MAG: hypothetical protein QOG65_2087, partial [Actinomycetota bacterium]|nr:hypothetical protein [Actinomycetota bacterium]